MTRTFERTPKPTAPLGLEISVPPDDEPWGFTSSSTRLFSQPTQTDEARGTGHLGVRARRRESMAQDDVEAWQWTLSCSVGPA